MVDTNIDENWWGKNPDRASATDPNTAVQSA
jgi:hypothetical protein